MRKQEPQNHSTENTKLYLNPILSMELQTLIVSFLLATSFLLSPCASHQLNLNKQLQKGDHAKFYQPSLPRKLMHLNHETVKTSAVEDSTHNKVLQGKKQHEIEANVLNAAEKETWKSEGLKEEEEYSTMDYGWVKKRRPIHNKQIPFIP